jgi:hypothetical protein
MALLSCEVDGVRHAVDLEDIMASEWKDIQAYTGCTPVDIQDALQKGSVEACEAIFWLVSKRAGNVFAIGSADFPLVKFLSSFKASEDKSPKDPETPVSKVAVL